MFFFAIFAVIDFSWLFYAQMNMQDAVREAGRYASTGDHQPNPAKPQTTESRLASINQILDQYVAGATVDPGYPLITSVPSTGGPAAAGAGGPGDTVTITVKAGVPLLTTVIGPLFGSDNEYHFTVSASFKNEPFPPSQTQ